MYIDVINMTANLKAIDTDKKEISKKLNSFLEAGFPHNKKIQENIIKAAALEMFTTNTLLVQSLIKENEQISQEYIKTKSELEALKAEYEAKRTAYNAIRTAYNAIAHEITRLSTINTKNQLEFNNFIKKAKIHLAAENE